MRGRGERSRAEELEDELIRLRLFTRRLWASLRARAGSEVDALLDELPDDERRAVDRLFDAAQTVWDKHKVLVTPCRTILHPGGRNGGSMSAWPVQDELFVGRWPDGSSRNLTRDQLLMMGGQDLAPAGEAAP